MQHVFKLVFPYKLNSVDTSIQSAIRYHLCIHLWAYVVPVGINPHTLAELVWGSGVVWWWSMVVTPCYLNFVSSCMLLSSVQLEEFLEQQNYKQPIVRTLKSTAIVLRHLIQRKEIKNESWRDEHGTDFWWFLIQTALKECTWFVLCWPQCLLDTC